MNGLLTSLTTNDQLLNPAYLDKMMMHGINKNAVIGKYQEFFYVDRKEYDVTEDMIYSAVDYLRSYVIELYMKQMYTFDVPAWFFDPMYSDAVHKTTKFDTEHDLKIMSNILKRLLKKFPENENLCWKIRSDRCVMYFELFRSQNVSADNYERNALCITIFDPVDRIVELATLTMDKDNVWHYDNAIGPFYVMADNRDLRKIINPAGAGLNSYIINVVKESLRMIKNRIDDYITGDDFNLISRMHSPIEMDIFRKLMTAVKNGAQPGFPLLTWKYQSWDNFMDERRRFKKLDELMIHECFYSHIDEYPLIDLTEKEWDYIDKYVNNFHFFKDNADEHDIRLPFLESRYGTSLTVLIGGVKIITKCIYDKDLDILRIYIIDVLSDTTRVFAAIDFRDISAFNGDKFISMGTNVIFKSINHMAKSVVEFYPRIKKYFLDDKDLLRLGMRIVGLHIVIHDRPHRTKMIKCTKRVSTDKQIRNYRKNDEKEFVVSRILRPAKEAKKYVDTMQSDEKREFEYVLESWPRMAHTRRLKNGKVISVRETTCHRHFELTEKSVIVKM